MWATFKNDGIPDRGVRAAIATLGGREAFETYLLDKIQNTYTRLYQDPQKALAAARMWVAPKINYDSGLTVIFYAPENPALHQVLDSLSMRGCKFFHRTAGSSMSSGAVDEVTLEATGMDTFLKGYNRLMQAGRNKTDCSTPLGDLTIGPVRQEHGR